VDRHAVRVDEAIHGAIVAQARAVDHDRSGSPT
jgi:hypothetical protein